MRHVADFAVQAVGKVLNDRKRPLKERFRALFTLRNLGGSCAIECISKCFDDPSALLKHELAYCLGQMKDTSAIPTLISVLKDVNQEPIVRHEAAEALGAIGMPLGVLEEFTADKESVVAETCQLALKRIAWLESPESKEAKFQDSPYSSIDPAPPLLEDRPIQELKIMLLDSTKSLFERYRAMFTLRDSGSTDAVLALSQGLKCPSSALFRHEVAYVLGQIQEEAATPYLKQVLADSSELGMVRHECAEALGAIASQECMDILKQFENDPEALVRESCEVALDMCEYENSDELQYANTLLQVQPEALI
ncbi:deoxyhypusine hydroxylase-like [Ornithodoros turicata]|uniref:Deoxyhypusine hydroxylase n=1 Tax=Ornithodoros turicata TaxID=34597 RepID=A0A2R5L970_9ACAR